MKCRVALKSRGNGWEDEILTDGELVQTAFGALLYYGVCGDKCELSTDGKRVVQERRGNQNISLSFEEGRRTRCSIGTGGLCGSYEIFTRSLKVVYGKGGMRVALEYLGGEDGEEIFLTLTAAIVDKE